MTLDTAKYLQALYPPPLHKPCEAPRVFLLRWNNSKLKTRRKDDSWHECMGVRFPNGRVALDFGQPYESMSELEAALTPAGLYRVEWVKEQEGNE